MIKPIISTQSVLKDYCEGLQLLLDATVDVTSSQCSPMYCWNHFESEDVAVLETIGGPALIRNGPSKSKALYACYLKKGESSIRHEDGSINLQAGKFLIFKGSRQIQWVHKQPFEMLGVSLPEVAFSRCYPEWALSEFVPLDCGFGESKIFFEIAKSMLECGSSLAAGSSQAIGAALLKLLSTSILKGAEQNHDQVETQADFHRRRVKQFCRLNLSRPDLNAQMIAKSTSISTSHLHRIFEDQPQTLMAWIQAQRLEASRSSIDEDGMETHTLTSIALSCGFKDSAHFSHSFKRYFGISPREYRGQKNGSLKELQRR